MKIILERNLDFRQFQNLIILLFCCAMVLLGMLNSLEFGSYIYIELILFISIVLFFAILFTKKGLYFETNTLYKAVFLFGFLLSKKNIYINENDRLAVLVGRLSTKYNYSTNVPNFHNWEPDVNASVKAFSFVIINEELKKRIVILKLTKYQKVQIAIDFIVRNTELKYE